MVKYLSLAHKQARDVLDYDRDMNQARFTLNRKAVRLNDESYRQPTKMEQRVGMKITIYFNEMIKAIDNANSSDDPRSMRGVIDAYVALVQKLREYKAQSSFDQRDISEIEHRFDALIQPLGQLRVRAASLNWRGADLADIRHMVELISDRIYIPMKDDPEIVGRDAMPNLNRRAQFKFTDRVQPADINAAFDRIQPSIAADILAAVATLNPVAAADLNAALARIQPATAAAIMDAVAALQPATAAEIQALLLAIVPAAVPAGAPDVVPIVPAAALPGVAPDVIPVIPADVADEATPGFLGRMAAYLYSEAVPVHSNSEAEESEYPFSEAEEESEYPFSAEEESEYPFSAEEESEYPPAPEFPTLREEVKPFSEVAQYNREQFDNYLNSTGFTQDQKDLLEHLYNNNVERTPVDSPVNSGSPNLRSSSASPVDSGSPDLRTPTPRSVNSGSPNLRSASSRAASSRAASPVNSGSPNLRATPSSVNSGSPNLRSASSRAASRAASLAASPPPRRDSYEAFIDTLFDSPPVNSGSPNLRSVTSGSPNFYTPRVTSGSPNFHTPASRAASLAPSVSSGSTNFHTPRVNSGSPVNSGNPNLLLRSAASPVDSGSPVNSGNPNLLLQPTASYIDYRGLSPSPQSAEPAPAKKARKAGPKDPRTTKANLWKALQEMREEKGYQRGQKPSYAYFMNVFDEDEREEALRELDPSNTKGVVFGRGQTGGFDFMSMLGNMAKQTIDSKIKKMYGGYSAAEGEKGMRQGQSEGFIRGLSSKKTSYNAADGLTRVERRHKEVDWKGFKQMLKERKNTMKRGDEPSYEDRTRFLFQHEVDESPEGELTSAATPAKVKSLIMKDLKK